MPQLKGTDWQIGEIDKSHRCAVFRRPMCKDTHRLKIKKAGVAILVSYKTDFKPTKIKKDPIT